MCSPHQVFKFIYACRLAETGLCAQAFHYCEVISRALLTQSHYHSVEFISQLIEVHTHTLVHVHHLTTTELHNTHIHIFISHLLEHLISDICPIVDV